MSKKTLLSETQIRQFMKYANIGGLADDFLSKGQISEGKHELEEREHELEERAHELEERAHELEERAHEMEEGMRGKEMEEGMRGKEMEEGMHELEEAAHEMEEGMHELEEAMHDDDEKDEKPVAAGGDVAEEIGLAVARAVRDALEPFGVSVDVEEGDEGPDDGLEMDKLDLDLDDDDDDDDDDDVLDLDEAVDKITKRVTKRIQKLTESKRRRSAKDRNQQIEDVTNRILERIRNSA